MTTPSPRSSASKPDLRFDIDALFEHLTENLGHELAHEKDWNFHLRAKTKSPADLERLASLGDELAEEFIAEFQEETEEEHNGKTVMGPALLTIIVESALMPDEVKALATRFQTLARQQGLVYDGVACYEPVGGPDDFVWLELEEARPRLQALTEEGLTPNAPILFVFALATDDEEQAAEIEQALVDAKYVDIDCIEDDEAEDGEDPAILVIGAIAGRNTEKDMVAAFTRTAALAKSLDAELLGVQFAQPD